MPSSASTVGALALPIPVGSAGSALADPLVVGLLDYLAFWLNWGLNAKLAAMTGTSATAVPTANRFPFDPQKQFVRRGVPALYVWCPEAAEVGEWTTLQRISRRTIRVQWVFDELVGPNGLAQRHGLLRAVDALLLAAETKDRHYDWPDAGSAYYGTLPQGCQFGVRFGLRKWVKQAAEYGAVWQIPDGAPDGASQFGYPALRTSFLVEELEGFEAPLPSEVDVGSLSIDLSAGDSLGDMTGGGGGLGLDLAAYVAQPPTLAAAIADDTIGA